MRRSIATVSVSGTLEEKLRAVAGARFGTIELFENDLINFDRPPRALRQLADDLGLTIELYQPFRDFEGVSDDVFRRNLDRAERKFDVMGELGAPIMLVCSNVSPRAMADDARSSAQLHELAERAARRNLRIAHEALAWGMHVRTFTHAWQIVERTDHPHLGLNLDSYHTLSLGDDPSGIADLPGNRIFFSQVADAPRLTMDPLSWSRHFRCFPGQGDLDLAGFLVHWRRAKQANFHAGRTERRAFVGESEIAHSHELTASCRSDTPHHGDHRLRNALDRAHHVDALVEHTLIVTRGSLDQLAEIVTR